MKFTLRDLFWLLLVIAIATGWYVHHRETMQAVRRGAPMLYETMTGENVETNRLKFGYPREG
jgi:hypothetical protein